MAQNFIPLFTNKIIGLKRVERNRTTFVNLVDYSWERANEGDNLSEQTLPEDENNDDNTNSSDSSESDGPPNQDNRDQDDSHHDRENHHSQSEETNKRKLNVSVSSKRKREDNYPSSNQIKDHGHLGTVTSSMNLQEMEFERNNKIIASSRVELNQKFTRERFAKLSRAL